MWRKKEKKKKQRGKNSCNMSNVAVVGRGFFLGGGGGWFVCLFVYIVSLLFGDGSGCGGVNVCNCFWSFVCLFVCFVLFVCFN